MFTGGGVLRSRRRSEPRSNATDVEQLPKSGACCGATRTSGQRLRERSSTSKSERAQRANGRSSTSGTWTRWTPTASSASNRPRPSECWHRGRTAPRRHLRPPERWHCDAGSCRRATEHPRASDLRPYCRGDRRQMLDEGSDEGTWKMSAMTALQSLTTAAQEGDTRLGPVEQVLATSIALSRDPVLDASTGAQQPACLADRSVLGRSSLATAISPLRNPSQAVLTAERLLSAAFEARAATQAVASTLSLN